MTKSYTMKGWPPSSAGWKGGQATSRRGASGLLPSSSFYAASAKTWATFESAGTTAVTPSRAN